eukprot:6566314-Prymnesium_polylepis.1
MTPVAVSHPPLPRDRVAASASGHSHGSGQPRGLATSEAQAGAAGRNVPLVSPHVSLTVTRPSRVTRPVTTGIRVRDRPGARLPTPCGARAGRYTRHPRPDRV